MSSSRWPRLALLILPLPVSSWLAVLATAVFWLAWPYVGIYHDALFYVGDAVRRLAPESLSRDLFFGAGTQGNFSIYGPLLSAAIDRWGAAPAALWATLASHAFWLLAFVLFCRAAITDRRWTWIFAVGLVLPTIYDGLRVFSYAEMFATPRPWAEALVLCALAAWLRGWSNLAWGVCLLAGAVHPLMALPGLGVLFLLLPPAWRWRLALAGGATLVAMALAHWGPAAALLQRYDDAWWLIVSTKNRQVLLTLWEGESLSRIVLWAALLLAAARWTPAGARPAQLARALCWALLIGVTAALLANGTRDVLLIQLQLWRVLWLVQLTAPLLWLGALPALKNWTRIDRLHVALCVASLSCDLGIGWLLCVVAFAIRLRPIARVIESRESIWRLVMLGTVALLLIAVLQHLPDLDTYKAFFDLQDAHVPWLRAILNQPLWMLALLVLAGWGLDRSTGWPHRALVATCLTAACVAPVVVACWGVQDVRKSAFDVGALDRALPRQAVVYWDRGLQTTWIGLSRASYISSAAGDLFYRSNALERKRRLRRLEVAGLYTRPGAGLDDLVDLPVPEKKVVPKVEQAAWLCQDPALDWVILSGTLPGADRVVGVGPRHFPQSIFDCARHRGQALPTTPSS